eukprot:6211506-Pleurochrysis_carterae.AAC.1
MLGLRARLGAGAPFREASSLPISAASCALSCLLRGAGAMRAFFDGGAAMEAAAAAVAVVVAAVAVVAAAVAAPSSSSGCVNAASLRERLRDLFTGAARARGAFTGASAASAAMHALFASAAAAAAPFSTLADPEAAPSAILLAALLVLGVDRGLAAFRPALASLVTLASMAAAAALTALTAFEPFASLLAFCADAGLGRRDECSGATSNSLKVDLAERRVDRSARLVGPAVVEEPRAREAVALGVARARLGAHGEQRGVQRGELRLRQAVGRRGGVDLGLPQAFVRHPVADATDDSGSVAQRGASRSMVRACAQTAKKKRPLHECVAGNCLVNEMISHSTPA